MKNLYCILEIRSLFLKDDVNKDKIDFFAKDILVLYLANSDSTSSQSLFIGGGSKYSP